jgi:G:T-mismatch repair DNA endonuclease (very short patch repair protein)
MRSDIYCKEIFSLIFYFKVNFMKVNPKPTTKTRKKTTTRRKKKGKLAKQLSKMNGTSKLEDEFEEILIGLGEDYVHHYMFGGREFDFCLPEYKLLIELHGCFFHACAKCGKEAKFSVQKKSVKNDKHKVLLVKESNDYTLLTFWEHEVKKDKDMVVMTLIDAIS